MPVLKFAMMFPHLIKTATLVCSPVKGPTVPRLARSYGYARHAKLVPVDDGRPPRFARCRRAASTGGSISWERPLFQPGTLMCAGWAASISIRSSRMCVARRSSSQTIRHAAVLPNSRITRKRFLTRNWSRSTSMAIIPALLPRMSRARDARLRRTARRESLIQRHSGFAYHFRGFFDFDSDSRREIFRCAAHRVHALHRERFLKFPPLHDFYRLGIEPRNDVARQSGRAEQAEKERRFEPRQARSAIVGTSGIAVMRARR